ncbi:MAG: NAD(P)/FAD-dependent oxidoreductase [Thermoplasmata archaeon]|nr:NAD(P)/FAD-dependent oxidoreductase [Thermoplasmata archaeon]
MQKEYDVIVVGAGPGGSTAARFAAMGGAKTLLIEKRQEIGTHVRCGEGLAKGLLDMAEIPVDRNWIACEVDGARIISPGGMKFEVDEAKAGNETGYVIERDLFDRALAKLAGEAGADIKVKTSALGIWKENGKIVGLHLISNGEKHDVRCKIIIGADGYESQVGRWAGIDTTIADSDIMTCVQYRLTNIQIDSKYTEFYAGSCAPGGYIWVFPKNENTANVGIGLGAHIVKHGGEPKEYLDRWIAKQPGMKNAVQLDMVAGGCSINAPLDSVVCDHVMLVGDAARMIDPMTGGGIAHACMSGMQAGKVAADAIKAKDYSKQFFQTYEKAWRGKIEEKLFRNWMATEKVQKLSDETFDKLIGLLAEVGMENISVFNILKAIKDRYPELVKEFEDLL